MSCFRREKYVPRGGPDGGDGARGGHVYLKASKDVDSLLPLYFRPIQKAAKGGRGGSKKRHGRTGEDLYIAVPCGTVALDFESGDFIGETLQDGQELLIAQGGEGGLGNCRFATSSHQAPTEYTLGEPGKQKILRLELKLVADVGLVGYPNAGKSTLVRKLTNARPKVASYPFTTLNPIIGTIQFEDMSQIRIADIPGLIDGAHEGIGLGHEFLRHIERTSLLAFMIDMAGTDGRNPSDDFLQLRNELRLYDEQLEERPYIVLANKLDVPGSDTFLDEFKKRTGENPLELIAEIGEGINEVKDILYDRFQSRRGDIGTMSEKTDMLFPARCHIKVIAHDADMVQGRIDKVLGEFGFTERVTPGNRSASGTYLTFNVSLMVISREQMRSIDKAICCIEGVRMVL